MSKKAQKTEEELAEELELETEVTEAASKDKNGPSADYEEADDEEGVVTEEEDEEEMEESIKVDFSDDLNALVEGTEGLTEGFKDKAATIFEAAVSAKFNEYKEALDEQFETRLQEETESVRSNIMEQVDDYLTYAVEQWIEENRIEVTNGIRTEIAEGFMTSLKNLFVENYMEVPESKVDLFEAVESKNSDLEEQLDEANSNLSKLQEEVETLYREKILAEASEDLAQTQAAKLEKLVEDIEFSDVKTFSKKVQTIKESYFNSTSKTIDLNEDNQTINSREEIVEEGNFGDDSISPQMKAYVQALSRTAKK